MKHTYDDWIAKLKQELKTEDLTTRHIKLRNGIIHNPMINPDAVNIQERKLVIPGEFSIGHCLESDNGTEINNGLISLLSHGMKCFRVLADNKTDWGIILKDIHHEMVFIDIETDSSNAIDSFLEYIPGSKGRLHGNISIQSGQDITINDAFYTILDFRGLKPEHQVKTLREIRNAFSSHTYEKIKIRVEVGGNLLETIPFIRAIRSLESDFFKGSDLLIEANCKLSEIKKDPAERLIAASVVAMWCRMAGINHLFFDPINVPAELEHAIQLLNIQNLMSYEAKMDITEDPLKGAYIIESLTDTLLQNSVK